MKLNNVFRCSSINIIVTSELKLIDKLIEAGKKVKDDMCLDCDKAIKGTARKLFKKLIVVRN